MALPSWSKALKNVGISKGKFIIGTTTLQEEMEDVIDEYCRSLPCDFVKSHPKSMDPNNDKNRLLWQMKAIPYDGSPFSVVSHSVFQCSFSMDYHSKKKRKTFTPSDDENVNEAQESPPNVSTPGAESGSRCPAKIIMKKIKRYPSYSFPIRAKKYAKISALKLLKKELEEESLIVHEDMFWVQIPLPTIHNHQFHGKFRFIHHTILTKIKELINNGDTSPEDIKRFIDDYVNDTYKTCNVPPASDDQAYYPSLRRIKDLKYNLKSRKKSFRLCPKEAKRRKNKQEDVEDELSSPSKMALTKPNTLQDVVQAFCSDPFEDTLEMNPQDMVSEADVNTLRDRIKLKLTVLRNTADALNGHKELQELLDQLNTIPTPDQQQLNSSAENNQLYPIDLGGIPKDPPLSNSHFLSSEPIIPPLHIVPSQNGHCSGYTKVPEQSFLTAGSREERFDRECKQLRGQDCFDFNINTFYTVPSRHPVTVFRTQQFSETQSRSSFLLPTTAQIVYHVQQLPVVSSADFATS